MDSLKSAWLRLPLAARKFIVDFAETFVGLVVALNLVIPGDLDQAKAQGLLVLGAAGSALISAGRRAAPTILDWLRTVFPATMLRLLLVVALAVGLVPVAPVAFPGAATPASANIGPCTDAINNYQNGDSWDKNAHVFIDEIRGQIDVGGHFFPCSVGPPDNAKRDGVNMHIALGPAVGNPKYGDPLAALTLGVTSCNYAPYSFCDGPGTRRFFGEASGCTHTNLFDFTPQLGAAPGTLVKYRIAIWSTTVTFHIYVNGAWTQVKSVPRSDPALCWLQVSPNYTQGYWMCETWDGGDSCGDSDNRSYMFSAEYKVAGGVLTNPVWALGTCEYNQSGFFLTHHCNNNGIDQFNVYSS